MSAMWVLSAVLAAGPGGGPRRLSLQQALEIAGRENPELVEAARAIPIAEAMVEAARALPNPTLGVSLGPDEPKIFGTLDQRLPIFGQRGSAIAAAAAELPVARATLDAKRLALRARVRRAYAALAAAQAQIALADQSAKVAGELAQMIREKFRTGAASELEAEQAELARRRANEALLDRQYARSVAQIELGLLLGEPTPGEVEASDPLFPLPAPPPLAELLSGIDRHPEVEGAARSRDAARAKAASERAAIRPIPDASLEVEKLPTSVGVGLRGGLAFDVPLLSQNGGAIAAEEARAAQAEARRIAAAKQLEGQIRISRSRWEAAARKARLFHDDLVPAAEHVVALSRLAFGLGRASLVDLLRAQADLVSVRTGALDAQEQAWATLADLEEAAGAHF